MISTPDSLYATPNALASHYSRFRVRERLLLTGHSHQAWPDCAERGQRQAWDDAAEYVDEKWERALSRADAVRSGFARLLDAAPDEISLGESTHALIVRWLSALPLAARRRIVTTDGEFHSVRRQLQALSEHGVTVTQVAAEPSATVGARLAEQLGDDVAAVITSTVFYETAELAGELPALGRACERWGAELLLDAYHQLNVVPFSLRALGLERAFVTGGGYKYCQLGEGNAFLRSPADCELRPIITGWFAEFGALAEGDRGALHHGPLDVRFAGATYDPTSHYRAAEVFAFHQAMGLSPAFLREVSQHQVGVLRAEFDGLDLAPELVRRRELPLSRLGGFLPLISPRAQELQRALARRGVLTDARNEVLRLGPAPYLSDAQLQQAVAVLGEVARALPS